MAVYLTRIHIYKNEYHLEFYIIINSFLDLLSSKLRISWNGLMIFIFFSKIFYKTNYGCEMVNLLNRLFNINLIFISFDSKLAR